MIGFGTIGRLVAERCAGLKMRVLGFDPFVTEDTFKEHMVEKKELEDLLENSDYVTLHCPVTDGTRQMCILLRISVLPPTRPKVP